MAFDLERWKAQIRDWWAENGPKLGTTSITAAYPVLVASAWLPLLEAYAREPGSAVAALAGVTAGVGSNLLANVVQSTYDRVRGGDQAAGQAAENEETRAELEAVLEATQALAVAQEALGDRWDSFAQQLARELAALPGSSKIKIKLGDGTQVGGSIIAGDVTLTNATFVGESQTIIHHADQVQVGTADETKGEDEASALRRRYLRWLVAQTRRLPLAGVDRKAASDEGSGDLELAAVYTALLTQRPESDEQAGARPEKLERQLRRLSALQLLNREPCLVLLGDPGSGKTTFVNFIALCLAGEGLDDSRANLTLLTAPLPPEESDQEPRAQAWDHDSLLPVRVVLRDLAARGLPGPGEKVSGETLWAFILGELGQTLGEYGEHLKAELMEKGGLILLDGLDEVPDAHRRREQIKEIIQGFAELFPLCRFLVTSRTYAYQRQDWKLNGFYEAVLSPFTPAQIKRFVDSWYTHVGEIRGLVPDDAQGRAVLLKTAIERSDRLAELAERPLLLTLMASLHAWRGGSLPEKREELYADAVDLLLDQWERPKLVRDAAGHPLVEQPSLAEWLKVDRAIMRAELDRLAFEAHRDQPKLEGTADLAEGQLVGSLMSVTRNPDVNPVRLVEYVRDRAGLLAARGEGIFTFPHRTFQEYLAACHLTDYGFPDDLADLLRADPQRWREVVLLAGAKAARGTASAAWSLAGALCYREPPSLDAPFSEPDCWGTLLAAQVLLENERERLAQVSERNLSKRDCIRRWLVAIVSHGWLPPADRALAGRALAVLGDGRELDELVFVPGGSFLMGSREGDEGAYDDEYPQHTVEVADFWIGKYPVTNGQYAHFVEGGGYGEERHWTKAGWRWRTEEQRVKPGYWDDPQWNLVNHPVVGVSWFEVLAYTRWLAEISGRPCRLPTEAEWEKAARGTDGRRYPWGDEWGENHANIDETNLGRTSAVGAFPAGASPYGALDMSGNVREWCSSVGYSEAAYPYQADDGREDLERDASRAYRGGSWDYFRRDARCAYRIISNPDSYGYVIGFRIVSPGSPLAES